MFYSWGVASPPTHLTSTGAPLGVSPSSSSTSAPSGSCSSDSIAPAALSGWPALCRLRFLRVGELGFGSSSPSPSSLPLLRLSLGRRRSTVRVVPVPWPLGIGPVAQDPGVGHYVGRPPACQGLSGPRWPGPAPQASLSPLMGYVRPRRQPSLLSPPPRSPPLHFVLLRSGGVLNRYWGCPPISWFRPRTNSVRGCLGCAPPSPSGWGPAPSHPPSLHAVRLGRTLLRSSHLYAGGTGDGAPLSVHAVR